MRTSVLATGEIHVDFFQHSMRGRIRRSTERDNGRQPKSFQAKLEARQGGLGREPPALETWEEAIA